MNLKKIKRIQDAHVGLNLGGALTGGFFQGSPAKEDAEAFKDMITSKEDFDKFFQIGKAKKRGYTCLALKVAGGKRFDLNGRVLKCVGNSRDGNTVTWYFFPEDGKWGTPNEADEL